MNYTVYDPTTGKILLCFTSLDAELTKQNLQDRSWIQGNYSSQEYYIDNNTPVAKPNTPDQPGQVFDFDYATKSWQINIAGSQQAARNLRNSQLHEIDKINPMWYASLSAEQQQQLCTYRQALLDVPQQADFPVQVNWPAKPTWL
jgi:hypothetical protein